MILDKNALVSDKQDLAQTAATYLSTYSYDTAAAATDVLGNTVPNDIGKGGHLKLHCEVTEAFTSAGSATVDFQLIQADDAALTSNVVVLQTTGAIGKATLVAGYQPRLALPAGITKRYLGLQYVIATATTTAGKVSAGFVLDRQTNPFVG